MRKKKKERALLVDCSSKGGVTTLTTEEFIKVIDWQLQCAASHLDLPGLHKNKKHEVAMVKGLVKLFLAG